MLPDKYLMRACWMIRQVIQRKDRAESEALVDSVICSVVQGRMVTDTLTESEVDDIIDRLSEKTAPSIDEQLATDLAIAAMTRLRKEVRARVRGIQKAGEVAPVVPSVTTQAPEADSSMRNTGRFFGMSLPEAAMEQLKQCPEPQSATEVWAALKATGFPSAHRDPTHAVMNALRKLAMRGEDVILVGKGKWDRRHRYTVAEIAEIEANLDGMASRDHAAHREKTKVGMQNALANGVRIGAERKVDPEIARRMFREGKTVEEVAAFFDCKSRQAVYHYVSGEEIWALQGNDPAQYNRRARRVPKRSADSEAAMRPRLQVVGGKTYPRDDEQS